MNPNSWMSAGMYAGLCWVFFIRRCSWQGNGESEGGRHCGEALMGEREAGRGHREVQGTAMGTVEIGREGC